MACCEEKINKNDVFFQGFFDNFYPHLSDLMCDAHNFEVFGNGAGALDSYDMMNDAWYLFMYAQVIEYEQRLRIKNLYPASMAAEDCVNPLPIMQDIWKEFNLDCILDYFKCKHKMDIEYFLRSVFGIGTSIGKGIDYMRIENNDDCIPPFKIV